MRIEDIRNEFPEMPEEIRIMIRDKVEEQLGGGRNGKSSSDMAGENSADYGGLFTASGAGGNTVGRVRQSGNQGTRHGKRLAVLLLAATLALGTTAFAGMKLYQMYTERAGTYGMKTIVDMGGAQMASENPDTEAAQSSAATTQFENATVRAGYLPEGMVEAPGGFCWYYQEEPWVGGISMFLYQLEEDDCFEIVDKDILNSEAIDVNGHSGVILTRRVGEEEDGTVPFDRLLYVTYPEAQLVVQMYVAENVSPEETLKFAEGLRLAEQTTAEEQAIKSTWKKYLALQAEPETEVYESKLSASREEMIHTHPVGEAFAVESYVEDEQGENLFTEDVTVKVEEVRIEDDLSLLNPEYVDSSLGNQTDEQGNLLPDVMKYAKRGDGIDSIDEILATETVAQKLVYVSVEYKNTGNRPLYNILFLGNLLKIQETGETFSIFDRIKSKGGQDCDMLISSGHSGVGEMQYYDVHSSAGHNGSNYIDELQPGEAITVHMGFFAHEDELGYLYLDLCGTGGAYEFTENSLLSGYVDIRQ